jgi:preprotein translocase subunit SecG
MSPATSLRSLGSAIPRRPAHRRVGRRLAAASLLAAFIWLPTVSSPPVVQAATCTGWSSTTTPPPTIRVLRTGTGVVETVDFKTYVKVVMPAEWPSTWSQEVLRAGAVAIKQYAWYYTMHYRGGTGTGGCYDVSDSTVDQIYSPTRTQYANQIQAVESTWSESITKGGTFVFTGYRPGTNVACGADADGYHLFQRSALNCATDGKTGEQILEIYYGPGLTIQGVATTYDPATYHALTPTRILDTRYGTGLSGVFGSHSARTFQVAGVGGVPAGATAVTGNLTVTAQTSGGYLYIGPNATDYPTSSTLNFPVSDDRANGVTVALGAGTLSVTYVGSTSPATTHVIFDVTGYFTPDTSGATYHALTPTRILDTRSGTGLSGVFGSHSARTFGVAGVGGVPANATAVTGNLTVTSQTSGGYLYIGPNAANDPTSSTLNFPVKDDRANGVMVALGAGILSVTYVGSTSPATTHVIFDVTGYFTPDTSGATYVPLTPARILDTRSGTGLSGVFGSHSARTFGVAGVGGVPANATAVTGNLTVTGQTSLGYLYVGPLAMDNPTSSTLNFPLGDDRANGVTVGLGAGGILSVTYVAPTSGPTAHAIFDVTGYFVATG